MRSFQKHLAEFEKRGVQIVAISADPVEKSREHRAKLGFSFPMLCDTRHEVIARYDLLHAGGGMEGDIARPGEFLIDSRGIVRWVNLTADYRIRPRPEDVLRMIDEWQAQGRPAK